MPWLGAWLSQFYKCKLHWVLLALVSLFVTLSDIFLVAPFCFNDGAFIDLSIASPTAPVFLFIILFTKDSDVCT